MNVFYEEEGTFKVGAILADNDTSLQVEAPHGKRSKVKSSAVLLRFGEPALQSFAAEAQHASQEIDVDFLWELDGPRRRSSALRFCISCTARPCTSTRKARAVTKQHRPTH
jgi:hypothetical protein